MRIVSQAELPEECQNDTLIKAGDRKRQRRLSNALEKTLQRCREMHAEQQQRTAELIAHNEREGFTAGYQHFFRLLLDMLSAYETLQHERQVTLRQQLLTTITRTLHDPIIVERIVAHMQDNSEDASKLTLILPVGINAPVSLPHLTCLSTDEPQITLQSGTRALRFPIDALCQQWLSQAEDEIASFDQQLHRLIPDTLNRIVETLQTVVQRPPYNSPPYNNKETPQ